MEDLIYMNAVKNIMKKRYIESVGLYSKIIVITNDERVWVRGLEHLIEISNTISNVAEIIKISKESNFEELDECYEDIKRNNEQQKKANSSLFGIYIREKEKHE